MIVGILYAFELVVMFVFWWGVFGHYRPFWGGVVGLVGVRYQRFRNGAFYGHI